MEVLIRDSAETGCVLGAKIIASVVREKPNAVLGLATGRTPLRLYQELIRLHREGQIDDRVLHELERDLDLEELAAIAAKTT